MSSAENSWTLRNVPWPNGPVSRRILAGAFALLLIATVTTIDLVTERLRHRLISAEAGH